MWKFPPQGQQATFWDQKWEDGNCFMRQPFLWVRYVYCIWIQYNDDFIQLILQLDREPNWSKVTTNMITDGKFSWHTTICHQHTKLKNKWIVGWGQIAWAMGSYIDWISGNLSENITRTLNIIPIPANQRPFQHQDLRQLKNRIFSIIRHSFHQ